MTMELTFQQIRDTDEEDLRLLFDPCKLWGPPEVFLFYIALSRVREVGSSYDENFHCKQYIYSLQSRYDGTKNKLTEYDKVFFHTISPLLKKQGFFTLEWCSGHPFILNLWILFTLQYGDFLDQDAYDFLIKLKLQES